MTKIFYKTTFTIDVLSENPIADEPLTLSQIDYAITEGDCVGGDMQAHQSELTPKETVSALYAVGSDPSFFRLDDDGNPMDEGEY